MADERGVVYRVNRDKKRDQSVSREALSNSIVSSPKATLLLDSIKRVIKGHTLTNEGWTVSISSLYFLIPLAKLLGYTLQQPEYRKLFDIFLMNFNMRVDGTHYLSQERIQIVPDAYENKHVIIEYMRKEDAAGENYPPRLRASKIADPNVLYQNYLYAVALCIALLENTEPLKRMRDYCLDELFSDSRMDISGGWVHYRLPWITARVLQSLHDADFTNRPDKGIITQKINNALDSLLDRIYNDSFWRSGAGDWVSKWESTGICLETLLNEKYITCDIAKMGKIDSVISYVFADNNVDAWLSPEVDMSTEYKTNNLLASVCLSSVLYKLMKRAEYRSYSKYEDRIENLFYACVSAIEDCEPITKQDCSTTEMLYYIAKAVI